MAGARSARYNITSESQLIDITAVSKGCTQIEEVITYFEECAKKVANASDLLDKNALSIDKTTMQPQLDNDVIYIKSIIIAIRNFCTAVRNNALQVYTEEQAELAEYKEKQLAKQQTVTNNNGGTTTP